LLAETGTFSSHLMAVGAVLTNGFDAGISSESTFSKKGTPNKGLRALKTFPSDPVYWVARSEFPPKVAAELTRAMTGLRNQKLFEGISRRIKYFAPAHDSELNRLREAMAVGAKYFGGKDEGKE
jgi:ABC-type phosphate/phosphonate transport system substrate-binding protein